MAWGELTGYTLNTCTQGKIGHMIGNFTHNNAVLLSCKQMCTLYGKSQDDVLPWAWTSRRCAPRSRHVAIAGSLTVNRVTFRYSIRIELRVEFTLARSLSMVVIELDTHHYVNLPQPAGTNWGCPKKEWTSRKVKAVQWPVFWISSNAIHTHIHRFFLSIPVDCLVYSG